MRYLLILALVAIALVCAVAAYMQIPRRPPMLDRRRRVIRTPGVVNGEDHT